MSIDAGPFYLAYVADSTVAFDPVAHARMDEYVFSFRRILSEVDKPILEVEMLNPHIGLLNPSRDLWVWFSWLNPSTNHIEPLFFGRIVGNPNNAFAEVITVRFTSWPVDFFKQRQTVAESLKTAPFWDEVFIPVERSDDPDTVLEARSELWCVDPITLRVTAEDIIDASDGNVVVGPDDHFYDGLNMRDGDAPLTAVLMDATVSWTQTARGYVDIGYQTINTFSGDGLLSEWPKPETQLGSGWSVQSALAVDVMHTAAMVSGTVSGSWTNTEKTHQDGDTLSINYTVTQPPSGVSVILTQYNQTGFLDPFAVDADGDPDPTNIPASFQQTSATVLPWTISTSLVLRYDMARQRTERVRILLIADLQSIINDPTVTQNTEFLQMTGRDVGVPIVDLLNWTTISDTDVEVGQFVFPDDPTLPGGKSAQVCVVAGHTGLVEPVFSDVPGDITVDGTAHWASVGTQNPTEGAQDWSGLTNYNPGAIILPRYPLWANLSDLLAPGKLTFPPTPTPIGLGQVVNNGGEYEVCVLDGMIDPEFNESSAVFADLGPQLPDGKTYFITPNGGQSGPLYVTPQFGSHTALHDFVDDNGIRWVSIGPGDIPAGGTPGNVWAREYFRTDRGRRSLEYLMAIQRAHIRKRARAVELDFETTFEIGVGITCRKTVTLQDTRLPGDQALGKVMQAELSGDGDSGEVKCAVTIGCCVGRGNAVTTVPGTPVYASPGYMQSGYQQETGGVVVLPDLTDVGYTPIADGPNDDGLVLPLDKAQVVITEGIKGTLAAQEQGIGSALSSMALAARILQYPYAFGFTNTIESSVALQQRVAQIQSNSVSRQLQDNPRYYEAQIKPVVNGPFFNQHVVKTQMMTLPMGINLEGASTP